MRFKDKSYKDLIEIIRRQEAEIKQLKKELEK